MFNKWVKQKGEKMYNYKKEILRIWNSINISKLFKDKENWVKWLVKKISEQLII